MTRAEKIQKLANAIRAFRGLREAGVSADKPGTWILPPQRHKAHAVVRWLDRLGFTPDQIRAEMEKIVGFRNKIAFGAWLRQLEDPNYPPRIIAVGGVA